MMAFLVGASMAAGTIALFAGLQRRTVVARSRSLSSASSESLLSRIAAWPNMADTDLAVLGISREQRTIVSLRSSAVAAGFVVALAILGSLAFGFTIGAEIYLLGMTITAFAAYTWSQMTVADDADEIRIQHERELVTYLSLVSMLLTGPGSVKSATRQVAEMFDGDLFRGITKAMEEGDRHENNPWPSLVRFADDRDLKFLSDMAGSIDQAVVGGARLEEALASKVEDGRELAIIDAQAAGEVANEKMTVPITVLSFGCMLFMTIPMILKLRGDL